MKTDFLNPTENSNGLFENGVGIEQLIFECSEKRARIIEDTNKLLDSRR
jgi:hypothetical protein